MRLKASSEGERDRSRVSEGSFHGRERLFMLKIGGLARERERGRGKTLVKKENLLCSLECGKIQRELVRDQDEDWAPTERVSPFLSLATYDTY